MLEPVLDEVVITRSSSPRAIPVDDLAELAEEIFGEDRVQAVDRLDEALVTAMNTAEAAVAGEEGHGAGVLVTGSVTVAAEARLLLRAPAVDAGEGLEHEQEELR